MHEMCTDIALYHFTYKYVLKVQIIIFVVKFGDVAFHLLH